MLIRVRDEGNGAPSYRYYDVDEQETDRACRIAFRVNRARAEKDYSEMRNAAMPVNVTRIDASAATLALRLQ